MSPWLHINVQTNRFQNAYRSNQTDKRPLVTLRAEKNFLGLTPQHLPHALMLPPPAYFPIFPSSHLAILFTLMLAVTSFTRDMHFRLVDICVRRLKGNTIVGRELDASTTIVASEETWILTWSGEDLLSTWTIITKHWMAVHRTSVFAFECDIIPITIFTVAGQIARSALCWKIKHYL